MGIGITDRMQAKKAFWEDKQAGEEIRALFEQVFSMISDIIWRYDVDSQAQNIDCYISPVADKMLGLPEGTIGCSFDKYYSYVHPDDLPALQKRLSDGIREFAGDKIAEYRMRKADGSILWVCSKACASSQPDGRITVFGTTSDITERKQAEEVLRQSEKHLTRAEKIARFGHWELLLDENKMQGSKGAKRIYGLEGEDWPLPDVQRIALPEHRARLDKALQELVELGTPYNVEFKIRRPSDGQILDIHSLAEYNPANRAVFGVTNDVTERKKAEEALRESELSLRTIFETSTAGIIIVDTNGRIIQANQRMAELFCLPAGDNNRHYVSRHCSS
jgi:PAS domain S-box-containing protein